MRGWPTLIGGLCVWAAHFVALYAIASIWPGDAQVARWLVIGATVNALILIGALFLRASPTRGDDALDRWIADGGRIALAIAAVAVVWQALPALPG